MKTGKTLTELATEIQRQSESKHDYVADTKAVKIVADFEAAPVQGGKQQVPAVALQLGDVGTFRINDLAHEQIAEHVKIPRAYYDRMRAETPDLLATNVERWFQKYPAARMVRTLDGGARAFLSNGYRPLDNFDFATATLPILAERKLKIMSCEITERRLYIKAVDEALFRDVPVGYKMGDGSHRIFPAYPVAAYKR